jgi:hypothetical protein
MTTDMMSATATAVTDLGEGEAGGTARGRIVGGGEGEREPRRVPAVLRVWAGTTGPCHAAGPPARGQTRGFSRLTPYY